MINKRSAIILKTLIQSFIADGKPLASKALVEHTGLNLSSATIRNILAHLEEIGLLTSQHTASAKVPTARGYRFFVDSLLVEDINQSNNVNSSLLEQTIKNNIQHNRLNTKQTMNDISKTISYFTDCASVVFTPYQQDILHKIEFIQLEEKKILLIFISNNNIQNYILNTEKEYTLEQIIEVANFINSTCIGLSINNIHTRLEEEVTHIQQHILELTNATMAFYQQKKGNAEIIHINGEHNLLHTDLSKNMQQLKKLFAMFDEKQALLTFLQECSKAQGIKIFIGGENQLFPINDMSVITMPYMDKNNLVGSLAIIGPMRMEYTKVISMLEVSSKIFQDYYAE